MMLSDIRVTAVFTAPASSAPPALIVLNTSEILSSAWTRASRAGASSFSTSTRSTCATRRVPGSGPAGSCAAAAGATGASCGFRTVSLRSWSTWTNSQYFLRTSSCCSVRSVKPWNMNGVSVHGRSSSKTYIPKCRSLTATFFLGPTTSLIDHFHPREVVGVLGDARRKSLAVRDAREVLDLSAENRDAVEAIRCADPSHAMSEFAQLVVAARGERSAQRLQLPAAVLDELRNEVLEIARQGHRVGFFSHFKRSAARVSGIIRRAGGKRIIENHANAP